MTRPGCVNFSGYSCVTKGLANEDIAQLKRGRLGVGVWVLGFGFWVKWSRTGARNELAAFVLGL